MRPVPRGVGPRFIRADTMATKLAIAGVVGSVLFALFKESWGVLLVLLPGAVFHNFAAWEPLTYAFVGRGALDVIFGCLIIWSIGTSLEATWGGRRLLAFALGTTVAAGAITLAIAFPVGALHNAAFFGLAVMATNLWVAYGLSYGSAQTNFWGMPLSGNVFALIGAGFVFLNGAYGGWTAIIPDVIGLMLTAVYIKWGSPRVFWLRFTTWRLQRQLKTRSKHLRVVTKDRNIGGGSDGYLH